MRCLTLNKSDPATPAGETNGAEVEGEPTGQTAVAGNILVGGTQQEDLETSVVVT